MCHVPAGKCYARSGKMAGGTSWFSPVAPDFCLLSDPLFHSAKVKGKKWQTRIRIRRRKDQWPPYPLLFLLIYEELRKRRKIIAGSDKILKGQTMEEKEEEERVLAN